MFLTLLTFEFFVYIISEEKRENTIYITVNIKVMEENK